MYDAIQAETIRLAGAGGTRSRRTWPGRSGPAPSAASW